MRSTEQTMIGDNVGYQLHFQRMLQQTQDDYDRAIEVIQSLALQPSVLCELPPAPEYFAGRQTEVDAAMRQMRQTLTTEGASTSIIAITGPAGVGKTALALHIAHQLKADLLDTSLYVNLRGGHNQLLDPVEVLEQFLRSWGVNDLSIPDGLEARSRLLQSFMKNKRTLLLLDNARDGRQIKPLIPVDIACGVLITSRACLSDLEDVTHFDLAELSAPEAHSLLQKLANRESKLFGSEEDFRAVELGSHLPLTICLMGKLLQQDPRVLPTEVTSRSIQRQESLKRMDRSYPDVRAILALSYGKLDPLAARLLRLLGLLVETNFTSTISPVLLKSKPEIAEAEFQQLVSLKFVEPVNAKRFGIAHDLIRLFVRGQLATHDFPETRQAVRLNISQWYLEICELMNLSLDPSTRLRLIPAASLQENQSIAAVEQNLVSGVLSWYDTEKLNLLAAIEWAYQSKAWELTARLAENLVHFFDIRNDWENWEKSHQWALEAARKLRNRAQEARILNNLGNAAIRQCHWEKAREQYTQSLEIFRELAVPHQEAETLINLGILFAIQNQQDVSMAFWELALTKLPLDSPESKKLRKWMQQTKPFSLRKASDYISAPSEIHRVNRASFLLPNKIFPTIRETIRQLARKNRWGDITKWFLD